MVPEGLERVEEVVEAEGEDGEGAVRLVRLLLAHRSAPEVMQEDCNREFRPIPKIVFPVIRSVKL